ncbi:MAG: hypothetical protein ACP6IP_01220 [Candidatus Njordarchaeia archaeon]
MGLIKSFVDSFFVFWASMLILTFFMDLRSIVLKELTPLLNMYYTAEALLASPFNIFFKLDLGVENIIGLATFILAAFLLGILAKSGFDLFWNAIIFTLIIFVIALPIDQVVAIGIRSGGDIGKILSQIDVGDKVQYFLVDFILYFPFAVIGRSYSLEEEPELSKTIEV